MSEKLPSIITEIAQAVQRGGGRALLVGGVVRDQIIGLPIKDIDLEVFGLPLEQLEQMIKQFGPVSMVGSSFSVLKLRYEDRYIDVAVPRRDIKTGAGHKGFSIEADPSLPPEEAARRRDFTINAIMFDPLTEETIDPFDGQKDIERKVLRLVDRSTFADDPLRVVRAFQFVARFGLSVDPETKSTLTAMVPQLAELPPERLYEEWKKLFLLAHQPSLGLQLAHDITFFSTYFPIIHALRTTPQAPTHHPEGDVWTHTMLVVDQATQAIKDTELPEEDRLVIMLGAFAHDFGKATTTKQVEDRFPAHGHEQAGAELAQEFYGKQGFPVSIIDRVIPIILEHMHPHGLYFVEAEGGKVTDGAIRRLVNRLHPANLNELLTVVEADALGRGAFYDEHGQEIQPDPGRVRTWLTERVQKLKLDHGPVPILQGRDLIALGWQPSPVFGQIIATAEKLAEDKDMKREFILDLLKSSGSPEAAVKVLTKTR